MNFEPMELSLNEQAFIEAQEYIQKITSLFSIKTEDVMESLGASTLEFQKRLLLGDVTEEIESTIELTETQKNLARALAVCGEVARLYKRRGQPPTWLTVTSERNHAWKRALRKQMNLKTTIEVFICGSCHLPFVASTRCQCKVARPRRADVA